MLQMTVPENPDVLERELIRKVAAGERAAFKQLFDSHSPRVYNFLLRLVGNSDDAEELTQDVFVSLWRHAANLRGESKLSTWLYRVAVNKSINFRKRGGLFFQVKQLFSLEAEDESIIEKLPAADSDRPDRKVEMQEARLELADIMGSLPARQREVYLLHKLEGLSYKEIADELHVSLGTIESLMHRAKENLQKAILKDAKKSARKSRPQVSQ
jgi:RNA polymerase sigma-70 factor, ECF subfamily